MSSSAIRKLLWFFEKVLEGRATCVSRSRLLSTLRLTPSELEEALNQLELRGIIFVDSRGRVCFTAHVEASAGLVEVVASILRDSGYDVEDVRGVLAGVDIVASPGRVLRIRERQVGFVIACIAGKVPPHRLVVAAKKVARVAARLSREWRKLSRLNPPKHLLPVVVLRRGAKRVVEGVLVVSLEELKRLIFDPTPYVLDPVLRVFDVNT
ncbi:MAG TPA: hypothetical protein EYH59_03450 [Pyrodictium sp.]|nr:hypothetical protein [Pyrodictium sp.]